MVQVHTEEPSYVVYDYRGSKTPIFVYQDMQRSSVPDLSGCKLAIDIGANVGLWSFRMAKLYPDCQFIAYEPYDINVTHLKMGLDENKLENVEIVPFAVTHDGAQIVLAMDPTNSGSASMYNTESVMFPKQAVQSVKLESVVGAYKQVDYLKVDIEGAEFHLFDGFESWDKLRKVFVEVHPVFLVGTDSEKRFQINQFVGLLKNKLGADNVQVDCTDERFREI